MAELTEQLKREHAFVLDQLRAARLAGIDQPAGRRHLLVAKEALLAHLQKEDKELYPVLRDGAAARPQLRELLDLFSADIQAVTGLALAFFALLDRGGSMLEISRELGSLSARLKLRIASEESQLYAEYDAILAERR